MRRPSTNLLEGFFMSETTQIHPDKVRAYLATDYRLGHSHQDIVLNIGKRSERLAALFAERGVNCGAFITAYNPRGTQQPEAANTRDHAELADLLHAQGIASIEGSGSEEGTDWPSEKSWFALGLELEPSRALGNHFNQDAIVWVGADAVPQLILLR
jgi:sugar phosphate isomerase/epimerase